MSAVVTQADRETFIQIGLHEGWSICADEDEEILEGQYDDDPSLQEIARHRTEATEELVRALEEARLQLIYVDERFPTGTTPAVLAQINAALSKHRGEQG